MTNTHDISLANGCLWPRRIAGKRRLVCSSGSLLVTLSGCTDDFCLQAGEHLDLDVSGLLLVEALEDDSRFVLTWQRQSADGILKLLAAAFRLWRNKTLAYANKLRVVLRGTDAQSGKFSCQ